jgi:polar amino acid transport system substrate-binding protein
MTFAVSSHAQSQPAALLITTENASPLSMSNDGGKTIYGRAADKVHEILRRSRIPYRMEMTSWNRAFELARTADNTCVFSAARTTLRESQFTWVGTVARGDWAIIGSTDLIGKVSKLEQIKSAQVGVYIGDAAGEIVAEHGIHTVVSYDDEITIKNLLLGRLDFWASESEEAKTLISKNKLNDKLAVLFTFGSSDFYLACNPAVGADLISKMRDKLREINDDGTAAGIDAKY